MTATWPHPHSSFLKPLIIFNNCFWGDQSEQRGWRSPIKGPRHLTLSFRHGALTNKKKRRTIFRCLSLLLLKGQASYLNVQDQEVRGSLGSPVILRTKHCSCFDRNTEVQTVNCHVWTWFKQQPCQRCQWGCQAAVYLWRCGCGCGCVKSTDLLWPPRLCPRWRKWRYMKSPQCCRWCWSSPCSQLEQQMLVINKWCIESILTALCRVKKKLAHLNKSK